MSEQKRTITPEEFAEYARENNATVIVVIPNDPQPSVYDPQPKGRAEALHVSMRAKMCVGSVTPFWPDAEGKPQQELLYLHGVAAKQYPEDGADENNTYAKFSPSISLQLTLANPALLGKFAVGDTFYVDFTPAPR
jgi:hypothetical protein